MKYIIGEVDNCRVCGQPLRKKRRGIIGNYLDRRSENDLEARLQTIERRLTMLENL